MRDLADRGVTGKMHWDPGALIARAGGGWAWGVRAAANKTLDAVRERLWPGARPREAARVCIFRVGNVGDTVCALPAIYAIRKAYPEAYLTLVTSPGGAGVPGARDLLAGAPWIDEIYEYHSDDIRGIGGRTRTLAELRRRRFDLWFELPPVAAGAWRLLRNMSFARAAGAGWAYGWRLDSIKFARRVRTAPGSFVNEVDRLGEILRGCGIRPGEPEFPLPITDHHRRVVDGLLRAEGLLGHELVALAPGAKLTPNRWPVERFVRVGRHLAGRGFGVVIIGGAADAPVCGEIGGGIGASGVSLAGRSSLLESAEILRRCRLLICNDSGVQHLAAAVGTQCLSLFSSREPEGRWLPYGSQHVVLRKWVECHTCLRDSCPYDNRCIKLIETDEVMMVANRVLGQDQGKAEVQSIQLALRTG